MDIVESKENLALCLSTPLRSIGEWLATRPGRFTHGERAPDIQRIGDWVGPATGLDDVVKRKVFILPGLELRPLCHPAHNQSLYVSVDLCNLQGCFINLKCY
jgi:hypothetical protein